MKAAIIYNKDIRGVINTFGMQNREFYHEIRGLTRLIDVRITREHRWSSTDICPILNESVGQVRLNKSIGQASSSFPLNRYLVYSVPPGIL